MIAKPRIIDHSGPTRPRTSQDNDLSTTCPTKAPLSLSTAAEASHPAHAGSPPVPINSGRPMGARIGSPRGLVPGRGAILPSRPENPCPPICGTIPDEAQARDTAIAMNRFTRTNV